MPIYPCPECETPIKKKEPLEAGKKLKCPECGHIFAPGRAVAPAKKAAAPPPPEAPRNRFDDEGPANYGLVEDVETKENEKERGKAFGPIKERFERSKRGPAVLLVVKPSNILLLWGCVACIMGLTTGLVATWDMIFKREIVEEKQKKSLYDVGDKKSKYKELSTDEFRERLLWLAGGVAYFCWGAVVCGGASRMHEVRTYWFAMLGSVMGFLCPVLPLGILLAMMAYDTDQPPDMAYMGPAIICMAAGLPITAWCVSTLLKEPVKLGFADDEEIV